jgi:putative hydrolase of HD superfamily
MVRLTQQIAFVLEIDRLKSVLRQTQLIGRERRENSAEHSWHIAVLAMLLAEHANQPVDLLHVVKMLLIHDIVEIDAGDTFAYSSVPKAEQSARERLAAQRIFGLLPADQQREFLELWEEFEARLTAEARFANAVDRLMPVLHNVHGNGGTWKQHQVSYEQVVQRLNPIGDGSAALWAFVQSLLTSAVQEGMLAPPEAT